MSKIHRNAFAAPLPTELEPALEEILALRSILIREREMLANAKVKNECDNRANKGHIDSLRGEYNQAVKAIKDLVAALDTALDGWEDQQAMPDPKPIERLRETSRAHKKAFGL